MCVSVFMLVVDAYICVCVCVSICMYICIYMYAYVCMHRCICMYVVCMCTGVCSCEFMCSVACCSDADSFVRFELGNERFEFVPVLDPIHWRFFEDQPMRWFGGSYRFVQ